MTVARIYPLPRGAALPGDWVKLHHRRLTQSTTLRWIGAQDEAAELYALRLWFAAPGEEPAGTLPEDPECVRLLLSAVLQREVTRARWARLGPLALHGWSPVLCLPADADLDDAAGRDAAREGALRRLAHPFVEAVVMGAWDKLHDGATARRSTNADRQRAKRVRQHLRDAAPGLAEAVIADTAAFNALLRALGTSPTTREAVERAMAEAVPGMTGPARPAPAGVPSLADARRAIERRSQAARSGARDTA